MDTANGPDTNDNLATLLPKVKNARKGFGFITFEREETMRELIKIGKVTICGMEVDLRKATPKQGRRYSLCHDIYFVNYFM